MSRPADANSAGFLGHELVHQMQGVGAWSIEGELVGYETQYQIMKNLGQEPKPHSKITQIHKKWVNPSGHTLGMGATELEIARTSITNFADFKLYEKEPLHAGTSIGLAIALDPTPGKFLVHVGPLVPRSLRTPRIGGLTK